MIPCKDGGDKHRYKLHDSPWNFLVFKCIWCEKQYLIPKFVFYTQMMGMGVFIVRGIPVKPKKRNKWIKKILGT